MTEYTSIRVTVDAKENAEASKRESETWNEYLQRCTDNPPEVREYVRLGDLRDRLDRIESAASTAEERTGSIENTLESAGLGR